MTHIKSSESVIALLADVVASRKSGDRKALQARLMDTIRTTNEQHVAVHQLRPTVGDEFQGVYASLGSALGASFTMRLLLPSGVDVRFGLARGQVETIDEEHLIQDGSAWWLAREAIVDSEKRSRHGSSKYARSTFLSATDSNDSRLLVQTSLDLVDFFLYTLRERDRVIALHLRQGWNQTQVAAEIGITPAAVSERVRTTGLGLLVRTMPLLESLE